MAQIQTSSTCAGKDTDLRSRTPTPADFRFVPSCFQKSSQLSIETFVSQDLPMAFRKASGVEMESAAAMPVSGTCNAVGSRRCSPRVSGIGRARVESERDIGRSARRRELELRLSSRLVIVEKLKNLVRDRHCDTRVQVSHVHHALCQPHAQISAFVQ